MEEYTYMEILIEDKSGGILAGQIMDKYVMDKKNITYRIHSFKGIGKIPLKANRMSQVKSRRLLTDLPMYLKGISSSLENMPGKKAIFVILDSDDEDCAEMKCSLMQMAKRQLLQKYVQDSIIGTWEYLADVVYKGGLQALKRNAASYYEIGMFKCECARCVGMLLDIRKNASPSFNYFIGKLDAFYGSGI